MSELVHIQMIIVSHLNVVKQPLEHNYVAVYRHLHLFVIDVREVIAKISGLQATQSRVRVEESTCGGDISSQISILYVFRMSILLRGAVFKRAVRPHVSKPHCAKPYMFLHNPAQLPHQEPSHPDAPHSIEQLG